MGNPTAKKTSAVSEIMSEYELLRLEKIKRNNERLAQLGLTGFKATLQKSQKKSQTVKGNTTKKHDEDNRSVFNTRSSARLRISDGRRSSPRQKRKPQMFRPSFDDFDDSNSIRRTKKCDKEVSTPVKKKFRISPNDFEAARAASRMRTTTPLKVAHQPSKGKGRGKTSVDIGMEKAPSPLSKKQKQTLKKNMDGDFLEKFEEYLTEIDPLSDQNLRNVLRQITKLHNGQGIRYESKAYGWPEHCYFMKNVEIGPEDDILHLMEIAKECEEVWGKDHGNGWLLSHPLKKLYLFQQYHIKEGCDG